MSSNAMMRKLITLGLVLGALGLAAAPAAAVDLAAKAFTMTMPDGSSVPMWGFVLDTGSCWTAGAGRQACVDGLPAPTTGVPGPRLVVSATSGNIQIRLSNGLPEPVSIVIPGQEMPVSTLGGCTTGPVRHTSGAFTGRVRSFGCEAPASGGRQTYRWRTLENTQFQPGTYIYHSGSHPSLQVHMGLYGAIRRNDPSGDAYPGVAFDRQRDLFYSEVDAALHSPPTAANSGNYNPEHFLLQRYTGQTTLVDVSIDPGTIPPVCIPAGPAGDSMLLRLYNTGLEELKPMMIGSHFDVVAEGGKPYQFARNQYSALLQPMGTRDLLWTPPAGGTRFPLIERGLSLTDAGPVFGTVEGGQQTCLLTSGAALAGGPAPPPPPPPPAETIDITRARYVTSTDKVVVWATSDLAAAAALQVTIALQGGGSVTKSMNWNANKSRWQRAVGKFSINFGTAESVTVFGSEGSEASPVEVM